MAPATPVVLIVGSDQKSLAMYALGLLAMGLLPVPARDAEEAFARACAVRPDVIVADVTLQRGSGVELAGRIRADARTKDAGLILLSGHAGAVAQSAVQAGCDRFLVKPCAPDALAVEIIDLLASRSVEPVFGHVRSRGADISPVGQG